MTKLVKLKSKSGRLITPNRFDRSEYNYESPSRYVTESQIQRLPSQIHQIVARIMIQEGRWGLIPETEALGQVGS